MRNEAAESNVRGTIAMALEYLDDHAPVPELRLADLVVVARVSVVF